MQFITTRALHRTTPMTQCLVFLERKKMLRVCSTKSLYCCVQLIQSVLSTQKVQVDF